MSVVPATPETIADAARTLREGRLVAFPTETVYGLGADATNGRAVAAIYEAKGRPRFNPLIVHVADVEAARRIAVLGDLGETLAAAFWPGPLTLVLPKQPGTAISDLATAALYTVAIRIPSEPVAQALLRAMDGPVVAPSANRSGHVSATTAAHVAADLGDAVATILDGGPSAHGVESTIVDATGVAPRLLRPGAVTAEAIRAAVGTLAVAMSHDHQRPSAPGQLESHYAPRAAVRLGARAVHRGEALLAFGDDVPPHDGPIFNLSPAGDLAEAAANLFAALRGLDASQVAAIAVMPIPDDGLGAAINDRLRRAAAPR
jgi:L-threonylcarbamoyladenylate synthase